MLDMVERFDVFAFGNKGDIPLAVASCRTGKFAWRPGRFADGKAARYCLRIALISCLAFVQPLFKLVYKVDRAGSNTVAAAAAFLDIDISGFL